MLGSALSPIALEEKINNVILVQRVEYTTQTMQLKTPDVNRTATPAKYKFNVEDRVKISWHKRIVERGLLPSWTGETLIIAQRFHRDPTVCRLMKVDSDLIQGTFYE